MQFDGETEGHRRVFVKNDPAALVVLDEGGPELADRHGREPVGLSGLQHGRNKRELALIGLAHRFDHAEVLDEGGSGKIDVGALGVSSLRRRRIHHIAVEPVRPRVGTGGDGSGIHHREGGIDGMVVRKDGTGSGKREVVRRDVGGELVGAKPVPHENDDAPRRRSVLLLLRSQAPSHS